MLIVPLAYYRECGNNFFVTWLIVAGVGVIMALMTSFKYICSHSSGSSSRATFCSRLLMFVLGLIWYVIGCYYVWTNHFREPLQDPCRGIFYFMYGVVIWTTAGLGLLLVLVLLSCVREMMD